MTPPNVLPLYRAPDGNLWRKAVAQVIRQLKAEHGLSNTALADMIGCEAGTVENAEGECNELRGATVARIGFEFGEEAIAPVLALWRQRLAEPAKAPLERIATAQEEIRKALAEIERAAA